MDRASDAEPGEPGSFEALTERAARHRLLTDALQLAVVVARTGSEARPPIPPPASFRPFLRHAKWTPRTMAAVRRVVDDDEEFRARVLAASEALPAGSLTESSQLWLGRPAGWSARLESLVREIEQTDSQRRLDKEERAAMRAVAELTEAVERHRSEAERALQLAAAADADLAEARRAQRELTVRVHELENDLVVARGAERQQRLASTVAEQQATEQREVSEALRDRLAQTERERDGLRTQVAELGADLVALRASHAEVEGRARRQSGAVADAVADAAQAAQALGHALARAADTLGGTGPDAGGAGSGGAGSGGAGRGGAGSGDPGGGRPGGDDLRSGGVVAVEGRTGSLAGSSGDDAGPPPTSITAASTRGAHPSGQRVDGGGIRARNPRRSLGGRRPVPLPPAVFEDSPEAARHLVRAGVLLVVDGYNVSLFAWPDIELSAQRERITAALAELAARTGASVRVVFDGDETQRLPPVRGVARDAVRVAFSDAGVDADEVIIDTVEEHPAGQPVVVATDDRRVQAEVRRRGANVLTTRQILGLLHRHGRGGHTPWS